MTTTPFRLPEAPSPLVADAVAAGLSITRSADAKWTRLNGTTWDPLDELRQAGAEPPKKPGRKYDVRYRDANGKPVDFPVTEGQGQPNPRQARIAAMVERYGSLDHPLWEIPVKDRREYLACRRLASVVAAEGTYDTKLGEMRKENGQRTFIGTCKLDGCDAQIVHVYRAGERKRPPSYCCDEHRAEAVRIAKRAYMARKRAASGG